MQVIQGLDVEGLDIFDSGVRWFERSVTGVDGGYR